jgi:hypothetical protein
MSLDAIRRSLVAASVALGLVLATGTADAQRHVRRGRDPYDGYARVQVVVHPDGLYLGAGLVATHILGQSGGPELLDDGSGLTLHGGLRLGHRLALELGWVATFHNPETIATSFGQDTDYLVLNGFTGDAKIYLGRPGDRIEPYVQGGVGLYLLGSTVLGAQSVGTGFQAGGGIDLRVGTHVDVGVRGLYRGIAMGPPRSDENDTFVSAVSAEANLTLRF